MGKPEDTCPTCGHTHPWHSIVCPKAHGANCFECEAILPRHYPWCSHGQRDNFFCWHVPRDMQRELEAHYNQHMKERLAQRSAAKQEISQAYSPETWQSGRLAEQECPECGGRNGLHAESCPALQQVDGADCSSQETAAGAELPAFE